MTNPSIKSRLTFWMLLPALFAILVLCSAVSILTARDADDFAREQGQNFGQQFASLLAPALLNDDRESGRRVADVALNQKGVRALSVYKANGERWLHSGPQFLPLENEADRFTGNPVILKGAQSRRFVQPIISRNRLEGWLELELSEESFLLQQYRRTLLYVALGFLCFLVAGAIALVVAQGIQSAMARIQQALHQLSQGDTKNLEHLPPNKFLGPLINEINSAGCALRKLQDELQLNAEQSNDELRETLETIEIQNVELSLAQKQALAASRAKTEFLANTSHEIRTPINGILGFSSLLLKTPLSAQQKEYLQTIQKSSQGLLTIINNILDVSKMDTEQLVLDFNPMNLREVLEETVQILAPSAAEKRIQLIAHLAPCLPLNLMGDPQRLKQVITNLVTNAIKFSDSGSVLVDVDGERIGERQLKLKVKVIDQGIGISPEQKDRLFHVFAQSDTSNARSQGGTGLGLALCKGLVEKMEGEIGVESVPRQGSTFWFTATLSIDRNAKPEAAPSDLQGERVLLIDQNPDSACQLDGLLSALGIQCEEIAETELEAALKAQTPLAILWDAFAQSDVRAWIASKPAILQLPTELLQRVVLLTRPGCGLDDDEVQGGFQRINKPVTRHILLQTLRNLKSPSQEQDSRRAVHAPSTSTPRQDPARHEEPKEQASILSGKNAKTPLAANARILAVDDNPANLQLIGELLKDLGVEVVLAKNGMEALGLCERMSFDLIFMDIQMPVIDGLDTTRRLREMERGKKRTPVVALTAHAMTDQKSQLLLAGLDDYLSKPVSEVQLLHVIRRWTQADYQPAVQAAARAQPLAMSRASTPVDVALSLKLSNNKPKLARDMLEMLLQSLPDTARDIEQHYKAHNMAELEAVVHKLHGGASYCGVPELKETSSKLDDLLRRKTYDSIHHPVASLLQAISRLRYWAEDHDPAALFDEDSALSAS